MFIWLLLMAGIVFLDQITKYLTVLYLKPVDTVPLWRGVLHLTYVENRGAAFGMLSEHRWVFMIISGVAIVALLAYLWVKKPTDRWLCVSFTFIIGGGIGNMIDRCALGYVVDMIDFRLINFAVFNVADSFVTVGAGILMVSLLISCVREMKAGKAASLAGNSAEEAPAAESTTPAEMADEETTAPEGTSDEEPTGQIETNVTENDNGSADI